MSDRHFRVLSIPELHEAVEKERANGGFVVDGLIPRSGVTLVVGDPMSGKTTTLAVIAMHMAVGSAFARREVRKERVLWIAEDRHRLHFANTLRLAQHEVDVGEEDFMILDPPGFNLDEDDKLEELLGLVEEGGFGVVIIDCLRRVSSFQENDSTQASDVMRSLNKLATNGRAIVVIHHSTKGGSVRGSSDLVAQAESTIWVRRKGPDRIELEAKHHAAGDTKLTFRRVIDENSLRLQLCSSENNDGELRQAMLRLLSEQGPLNKSQFRKISADNGIRAANTKKDEMLATLVRAGLVDEQKQGKARIYDLTDLGRTAAEKSTASNPAGQTGEDLSTPPARPPQSPTESTVPARPLKGGGADGIEDDAGHGGADSGRDDDGGSEGGGRRPASAKNINQYEGRSPAEAGSR